MSSVSNLRLWYWGKSVCTCNFSFYAIFLCSYTAINGRTHSRKINLYGYSYGTDLFSLSPAMCVKLYK